ncbi:MAG: MFS transporter, partial [Pseudomonadota bacterium]
AGVLALWFCLGLGSASAQLPAGRLLRRSADSENRPALFAAQFALSHAGWLITYPAAGLLGAQIGLAMTGWVLAALGLASTAIAMLVWPAHADEPVLHHHPDLPPDHPHLREGDRTGAHAHRHPPIIDERHGHWPRPAG